jgi:hypothetical protein
MIFQGSLWLSRGKDSPQDFKFSILDSASGVLTRNPLAAVLKLVV